MGLVELLTLVGTVATVISTVIAVHQARSAKRSSEAAHCAMAAVQLAAVAERLKAAQEHIRDVAPDKRSIRGFKIGSRIDIIRREFDNALSALPKTGKGSVARELVSKAQGNLNKYQQNFSHNVDQVTWELLQRNVQDAISELSSSAIS